MGLFAGWIYYFSFTFHSIQIFWDFYQFGSQNVVKKGFLDNFIELFNNIRKQLIWTFLVILS